MCKDAEGDLAWLRKVRPWWGHHYHFHVRLKCPVGSSGCINQVLPPVGDGCLEARKWVEKILNPPSVPRDKPKPVPKKEILLFELLLACSLVLSAD